MPTVLQASMSSVPPGAVTFLPSTVRFTSAISVVPAFRRRSRGRLAPGVPHQSESGGHPPTIRAGETPALHQNWFRGTGLLVRARPAFQMVFKFLAELFHKRYRGHRGRVTERTKRTAKHVFRQVLHVVDVLLHAATIVEPDQRLLQPIGPFAAGNAPAAALVLVKLHGAQCEFHNALLVVDHHHAAGSEHRPGLLH